MLLIEIIDELHGNYQFMVNEIDIHEIHPNNNDPKSVIFVMTNSGNYSHGKYVVRGSFQFWRDSLDVKYCIPEK